MSHSPAEQNDNKITLALGAVIALIAMITIAIMSIRPPSALPATAAAEVFSASRAMQHLTKIASKPHPTGTAANAEVRDYLIGQLKALGYTPEVQSGTVVSKKFGSMAMVHNIVLRIPGSKSSKPLMLAAHYDSAPSSPGAADDGASIAAILETLRALKTGPALQNDLIVLFTDGEEVGLFGAQLFTANHPLAKNIGLVLNFEFRGNSGPIWMFETSAGNGKLIDGWSDSVTNPLGNSLLANIYQLMTNDTDLSIFKAAGMPGLNFAAGENHNSYHSQLDTAELINTGSVQHEGDIMLALSRHFGNKDISDLKSGNSVYFNLPGIGLVTYPGGLALPLSLALLVGFGAVMRMARQGCHATVKRTVLATVAFLLTGVVLAVIGQLLWFLVRMVHPGYQLLLHGNTYNGNWYLAAFAALAVGLFSFVLTRMQRKFKRQDLTLGALLFAVLLSVITSLALPGGSFLFTWPVLPMLLLSAFLLSARGQTLSVGAKSALILLAAAPGVLIFTPIVHLLFFALTPTMVGVTMLLLAMFLCTLTPLFQSLNMRYVFPLQPLVAGLLLLIGGAATSGFDEQRPQPSSLYFVQDGVNNKAYWISEDDKLDRWNSAFFQGKPERSNVKEVFGPDAPPSWTAPATASTELAPSIKLIEDRSAADLRHITLEIQSARLAPRMRVFVDQIAVQQASVQSQVVTEKQDQRWRVDSFGMGGEPIRVSFAVKPGQAFSVRVRDISYGVPQHSLPARPAGMINQPFTQSDTTQLSNVMQFKAS